MSKEQIKIKNMYCPRCIKTVQTELEKLGYNVDIPRLGVAYIDRSDATIDFDLIKQVLEKQGFELLTSKNVQLVESIKKLIVELLQEKDLDVQKQRLSSYLAKKLNHEYSHLSTVFSSVENITIEKYYVSQKISRVKEMIIYEDLSFSEIATQLSYSSIQHLSTQFKNITGMSLSQFKLNLESPNIKGT